MKRYFVTGTDTGVGKTFVAANVARQARAAGQRVCAFKPIETGCTEELGADQTLLVQAAGGWQKGELRGPYQLRQPAAPLVAARAESLVIDLDRVEAIVRSIEVDLLLVEGAGGWRVPITETEDMAAFATRLAMPVIVVARAGLGTINHSLLTLEAIERDGCGVAALILSRLPSDELSFVESNRTEIARRWRGQILIVGADSFEPLL